MVAGVSTPQLIGVATLFGALPAPPIIWYVWDARTEPGVVWFILATAGGGCWALFSGASLIVQDPTLTRLFVNVGLVFPAVGAVCWLLLAVEYTARRRISRLVVPVLFLVPLLVQALIWTNSAHHLYYAAASTVTERGVYDFVPGPLWPIGVGYNMLLILLGVGMWVGEWVRADGQRKHQTGLLLLATLVLVSGILVFLTGTTGPFDPVPVVFVISSTLIGYALVEYRLFRLTPIGRETTVRVMDDPVFILDTDDRIVDANPAAKSLFDLPPGYAGRPATVLLGGFPALRSAILASPRQRELEVTSAETTRHLDMQVTPVELDGRAAGRVVVLRDITALKRRESELDLLKQVLSRVFRHNVRNNLSAIRSHAEAVRDRGDSTVSPLAETILDQSTALLEQTQKARLIERVVETDQTTEGVDLRETVVEAVEPYREAHPAVTFEVSVPPELTVVASPYLGTAVEQLVENAVEHTDTPTVVVEATREDRLVRLSVVDDGPGIHQHEIDVFAEGTERDLKHGTGVGLWLVRWVVDRSDGQLQLENTGDGTRATIVLKREESEASPPAPGTSYPGGSTTPENRP